MEKKIKKNVLSQLILKCIIGPVVFNESALEVDLQEYLHPQGTFLAEFDARNTITAK